MYSEDYFLPSSALQYGIAHWHLTTFKRSSGACGKSVVCGSSRHLFGAISIFLGPICPTSPSTHELRNTRVHCERRQQGVIPDRREPYRRVPLGRVHLDERRLDEVQ